MEIFQKLTQQFRGTWTRRLIHLSMGLFPFFYYWLGDQISHSIKLSPTQLVSLIVIATLVLDALRIKMGWRIYGQRPYEAKQLSGAAWAIFGIGIVLLQAPEFGVHGAAFGAPLIWSMCLGDSLMGEARLAKFSKKSVFILGMVVITVIWLGCYFWLKTPAWCIFIIPIITVIAESFCIPQFDDNALMLLAPLAAIFLLVPLFQ